MTPLNVKIPSAIKSNDLPHSPLQSHLQFLIHSGLKCLWIETGNLTCMCIFEAWNLWEGLRLQMFRSRVDKCHQYAKSLASQLGFKKFLR